MQSFFDMSTRGKLFIAFGLMVALMGAVCVIAYQALDRLRTAQRNLYEDSFASAVDIHNVRSLQLETRLLLQSAVLSGKAVEMGALRGAIDTRRKQSDQAMQRLTQRAQDNPDQLKRLEDFQDVRRSVAQERSAQTYPLLAAGKAEEARKVLTGVQAERDAELEKIADGFVADAEHAAQVALVNSDEGAARSIRFLVAVAVLSVVFALLLTMFLARVLADPLRLVSNAAERVSRGDLTVKLEESKRADELGVLLRTFRDMIAKLSAVTRDIGEGVSVLASSASEITAATTQVAAGSAETATAVSETTATVEEVKQTAELSAQKARSVSETAQKTVQVSQQGRRAVEDSIEAMHRIQEQMESIAESIVKLSEQSQAIGEIIATVNDLAEQSNMLAVNAAIEAAKAGEQGKGFAVVAQEVRSLAEQSKQATAQVRSILSDVQKATSAAVMATEQGGKTVEAGVDLSGQVGEVIRSLADGIADSAQAAMQIAASAQQQLAGMDQVALAMRNINQASAQNVASTRQAETAAHDLQELGLRLKRLVEQFRV